MQHNFSATPVDVLHSPFIFSLYNACFNSRKFLKVKGRNRFEKSIQRLSIHLKIKMCLFIGNKDHHIPSISNNLSWIYYDSESIKNETSFDLIYIDNIELIDEKILNRCFQFMHNDSIIFIREPYKNQKSQRISRLILNSEEARISVDVFYALLIFKRKEQVAQKFKLRWI